MRFAITLLFVVIIAAPCFAQNDKQTMDGKNKPDFTGTWRIDTKKSEFVKGTPIERSSKNSEKDGTKKADISYSTLLIEHREPEFRVVEKRYHESDVVEVMYYSDGRGESNTFTDGNRTESKTKWDGKKLVTTIFRKSKSAKKTDTIIKRISWELSKDGKTLTQTTAPVDPASRSQSFEQVMNTITTVKTVYQRVQD